MIISGMQDIVVYVQNEQPDVLDNDAEKLVAAIQDADHPSYGYDWSFWLKANMERLRDEVLDSSRVARDRWRVLKPQSREDVLHALRANITSVERATAVLEMRCPTHLMGLAILEMKVAKLKEMREALQTAIDVLQNGGHK